MKEKELPHTFCYGEDRLTIDVALGLCDGSVQGVLSPTSTERVLASRRAVDQIVDEGKTVYGINTGFGVLCDTLISGEHVRQLQTNILRSHSVGMGEPVPLSIAKMMMILKTHSLAQGYSGIALETLERLIWHIDHDVIPWIPSQGSVGASGDLAPLSHMSLPLIGEGKVHYQGDWTNMETVLQQTGLSPIELDSKEGLALINGTQFMAAYGVMVADRLHKLLDHADLIGAMMVDGLQGAIAPFMPELHTLRPYPGNKEVARRIRLLLTDSEILNAHADCGRVQDPYSLRCMPQVHGASRNAWLHLKETVEIEINAVTDNPIVFDAHHTISGGNFHGQPIALPLDYATLAAAELGNISDRRIYLSLLGDSVGLPKLLMKHTGINSGFMVFQFTSAALASENKSLCFPASADSIPTSLGQEDHVSMGSISARKAIQVIENTEKILAIELMCAAQAIDFRRPLCSSAPLEACHKHIRSYIPHAEEDRLFIEDLAQAQRILREDGLRPLIEPSLSAKLKEEQI